LRARGLLDRSVVVVYGDHQSFLGRHYLGPLLGIREWGAHHYLSVIRKVPLLVRLPHGERAGIRELAGGHLDIAPTLLALLGVQDPRSVMLGRDLTLGDQGLVVFRDGSFTDGRHYVLNRFGPASNSVCQDIVAGGRLDCRLLESQRREARRQLEISDLIIRGDLVPRLTGQSESRVGH
jgi:phosphoglycerol transferase MdoB-like AlkP superfamily enzyme